MRRFRPARPRRRMFRRLAADLFGPPPPPGMGLSPGPLQELERAHRLMHNGEYDEAADLFGQLADLAEQNALPVRAGHLHLQAARAHLGQGEPSDALARAERGLEILSRVKPGQAAQIARRVIEEFRSRGYEKEAEALIPGASPVGRGESALTPQPPLPEREGRRRGSLPAKCPHCGGTLRADEVEWIDSSSAECSYCGSMVKSM